MNELVLVLAFLASIFMAVSIGAATVASAFGPVNSARSANVMRSALLAGFFALVGAITQGANTTSRVGGGIIGGEVSMVQATTILFVAATLVIISVMGDYPMPTAFTVIGSVVGSGLGFGNPVKWRSLATVVGYWVLVPVLALGMSYLAARILRSFVSREDSELRIQAALLLAGCYVSYTAGASAAGLAVGPMTAVVSNLSALLLMAGLAMLLGAWMYSPRIIRAISFDYSNIGPRRSLAALLTSGLLAQVGVFMGVPISFNEAIIASVVGSGMVEGKSNSDRKKVVRTAAAWTGAFVIAGGMSFMIGLLIF
ncbi:MAG: anion permease [Candidatus Nanohaloarchaea archaeon]